MAGVGLDHHGECGEDCYQVVIKAILLMFVVKECGEGEFCDGLHGMGKVEGAIGWCADIPLICLQLLTLYAVVTELHTKTTVKEKRKEYGRSMG